MSSFLSDKLGVQLTLDEDAIKRGLKTVGADGKIDSRPMSIPSPANMARQARNVMNAQRFTQRTTINVNVNDPDSQAIADAIGKRVREENERQARFVARDLQGGAI